MVHQNATTGHSVQRSLHLWYFPLKQALLVCSFLHSYRLLYKSLFVKAFLHPAIHIPKYNVHFFLSFPHDKESTPRLAAPFFQFFQFGELLLSTLLSQKIDLLLKDKPDEKFHHHLPSQTGHATEVHTVNNDYLPEPSKDFLLPILPFWKYLT